MLRIFLTNLGKYNEGDPVGEWVNLPIDEEELEQIKERIGINEQHEEYFITDYETDIDGLKIGEYNSIDNLNEMAEQLDSLNEYEKEVISAMLSEGYDLEDALNQKDDCIVWTDCNNMEDVAIAYCEECGILDSLPENLRNYFDYEAFGRDMSFEAQFVFTSAGNCVQIL